MTFKEKLVNGLGSFGVVLYYGLLIAIAAFPTVMINIPFWLSCVFIVLMFFVPYVTPVFWIWGLVAAINGPQDWLAILYYILFVVIFLPTFINLILGLFSKRR